MLLYGLEAFALDKAGMESLDLSVNRFFMKLFKTSSAEIVTVCREMFNFELSSIVPAELAKKLQLSMIRVDRIGLM